MRKGRPLVGVTLGDPAGVGPELVRKAIPKAGRSLRVEVLGDSRGIRPGRPTLAGARIAFQALRQSTVHLKEGRWAAVVNGPVAKEWLHRVGFRFPGQTEFYAQALGVRADQVTMMMIGPRLRVALASTHISLKEAVGKLRKKDIVRAGIHLSEILRKLGVVRPKIAVCGLNPHAGEGGAFGSEEKSIVVPAVRDLQKTRRGRFSGPESPDAVFREASQGKYDGVVALYHDQGLIPAKLLDFDSTVHVTAGLPVVRCSPDHGTAFALAGRGVAREDSLVAALRLAHRLTRKPTR